MAHPSRVGDYDEMTDFIDVLETILPPAHPDGPIRECIERVVAKAVWPTSARDFVCRVETGVLDSLEADQGPLYYVCSQSVIHEACPPDPTGEYIRAICNVSGYLIKSCGPNRPGW